MIDLKTEGAESRLLINGRVTDGLAGNEVTISTTSPYNGQQDPVSGAIVHLLENEIELAQYVEYEPGKYRLDYVDSAKVGQNYQLLVSLPNGSTFRSLPSVMPDQAAIDHPKFNASAIEVIVNQEGTSIEQNLVQLYIDTEALDPQEDFYLTWNIIEAYTFQERSIDGNLPPACYITNDVTGQELQLFNGAEIKVDRVENTLLTSTKVDARFAFDFYYSIIQSTIDEAAYNYLSLINEVSNTQGSIFDKPAAPIPGNFRNLAQPDEEVLGYFFVTRSDTTRLRLRAEDVPGFISAPCPLRVDYSEEPSACLNCLLIENSTYRRPYYWFN